MAINNLESYVRGLWNWDFLNDVFRYGCRMTDIDGMTERRENFLFAETKRSGVAVPVGQARALRALATRGSTILTIWGEPNKPEECAIMRPTDHCMSLSKRFPCDEKKLQRIGREWFDYADGMNPDFLRPGLLAD